MKREDLYESINQQIVAEKVYRKRLRTDLESIKDQVLSENKKQNTIEKLYRVVIRRDLKMLAEKKETVKYSSTGLNALDDLFMNSNFLSTLEGGFNNLTTSSEQRSDYKNHVIQAVINIFRQMDVTSGDTGEAGVGALSESIRRLFEEEDPDLTISVMDDDLPEDKIVGPEKRARDEAEEEEEEDEDENAAAIDPDQDVTGRNRAATAISKVEKSVKDYYTDLGNPADRRDYQIYMLANLEMYFKTWEDSLKNEVNPENPPDVEQAISDAETKLDNEESGENEEELEIDNSELEDLEI
tara:strand:- start:1539 stop:2432 length:894 start_codon:yes stop_codon:yes gene_type:complete